MPAPWLDKIGPVGLVIAGLAVISLYLFIFIAVYLQWMRGTFRKVLPGLRQRDAAVKETVCRHPLGGVVWCALANQTPRGELQTEVQYLFQRNLRGIFSSLTGLRLISVISPLLGLLGTVLGITRVFQEMALADTVDNSMLAGGIWQALITTIMGLVVAVPTLIFHFGGRMQARSLLMCCLEETRTIMREESC